MARAFTHADLVILREEILAKDLLLRTHSDHILPDSGGHIPGPAISHVANLAVGDVVSAPVLNTAQFGPSLHMQAVVQANNRPGHPPLKVVSMGRLPLEYPIVPDPSVEGWRPAIAGLDSE